MDEQGRQRVADDGSHPGGPAKRTRPGHPVREHSKEEMGRELGLHGLLRLRSRVNLLGGLGPRDVVRCKAPTFSGPARHSFGPKVPSQTGLLGPDTQRQHGLFPVRVCGSNHDPGWRSGAGPDELSGLDALRASLGNVIVYCLCL